MSKSKIVPFNKENKKPINYQLITPIGICTITSSVPFAAMMTTFLLGAGLFGLKDENDSYVLKPFRTIEEALDITSDEVENLTSEHQAEIHRCLCSFKNPENPVDLGLDIERTAKTLADAIVIE